MKTNKCVRKVGTFILVIASVFVVTAMVAQPIFAKTQLDFFKIDSSSELVRPTDYRSWVYVGRGDEFGFAPGRNLVSRP